MKQTCLCNYLGIECRHPNIFLRLPASVRERIYRHVGLITNRRLRLEAWRHTHEDDDAVKNTLLLALLCRKMKREVEALVIRHNTWFCSGRTIQADMEALWSLKPELCAELRNVVIHMPETRLPQWYPTWLERWETRAKYFLRAVPPRQLSLRFFCNAYDNMSTARDVLKPFKMFPNHFKRLEICLGREPQEELRALARETVILAQTPPENHLDSFPLFKLPWELRRRIYSYTDLVPAFRNILWTSQDGFANVPVSCDCETTGCTDKSRHCNSAYRYYGTSDDIDHLFCSRFNSNSYSSFCKHGGVMSMLLANRALHKEVRAFFFENTRITVAACRQPHFGCARPNTRRLPPDDMEVIHENPLRLFIEKVGKASLCHIRELEIIVPRHEAEYNMETTSEFIGWREAIFILAKHAKIEALTMMLHIFTSGPPWNWMTGGPTYTYYTQSLQVIAPLRRLSRMKNLFIFLQWPMHWAPPRLLPEMEGRPSVLAKHPPNWVLFSRARDMRGYMPKPRPVLVEHEKELEKLVMGDAYDSFARGKGELLPSIWLLWCWHNCDRYKANLADQPWWWSWHRA